MHLDAKFRKELCVGGIVASVEVKYSKTNGQADLLGRAEHLFRGHSPYHVMKALVSVSGVTVFTSYQESLITKAIKDWLHYLHNSIRECIHDGLVQVCPICLIALVTAPGILASRTIIMPRVFEGATVML